MGGVNEGLGLHIRMAGKGGWYPLPGEMLGGNMCGGGANLGAPIGNLRF